jgi:carbon storage regulator
MLVLSRRVGEKIVIGNEIFIEVLSVSGEGVRLGISAPESTSIHRFEVFAEIQAANQAADTVLDEIEKGALENLSAHLRINQKQ